MINAFARSPRDLTTMILQVQAKYDFLKKGHPVLENMPSKTNVCNPGVRRRNEEYNKRNRIYF